MAELPSGMYTGERKIHPHFPGEEYLFRRVPHDLWDEASNPQFEEDAIEMPDMSVMRSMFSHPEWARLASHCDDWAVIGFQVNHIPPERFHNGERYTFRPEHVPETPRNGGYPHCEVRAFQDEYRISAEKDLPRTLMLSWRSALLRHIRIFLRAYEQAEIRQSTPASHKLE